MPRLLAGSVQSVTLPHQEAQMAHTASDALADFALNGPPLMMRLEDPQTGQQVETAIPSAAVRVLADALARLAEGQAVTLVALQAELSTQQAAELLGVSRPYFIKLLEAGKLPFRKVGEQRRVRYPDLLRYIQEYQTAAQAALDEMTAEAERLGLYA